MDYCGRLDTVPGLILYGKTPFSFVLVVYYSGTAKVPDHLLLT